MSKNKRKRVIKKFSLEHSNSSDNYDNVKSEPVSKNNIPWIEKYRPKKISDLVIDNSTRNKILKIIKDKNMPNIIITGTPGIGKTTTILCIARYLLGKHCDQGVIELNASNDRGIKAVQDSIIYFCKKRMDLANTEDRSYSKHKIVLLDEADNMTKKAQQLINNLMETYKNTTRFAFTCNNSSKIIEAIQSRCIIFRYRRLGHQQIVDRLKNICENEKVNYTNKGLNAIVVTSQGDLRKAINNLQLTYNGYDKIISKNVYKLCDVPHPLIIQDILMSCYKGDLKDAITKLNKLMYKGYSSSDISLSMINTLKLSTFNDIDELTKIIYMKKISKTCLIVAKGINTPLQLTGCVADLCSLKN